MEGDNPQYPKQKAARRISIHALRVEGDSPLFGLSFIDPDFYPRPPGGGRLEDNVTAAQAAAISIHALRVEGDRRFRCP